ncbi:uncharacterized protein [Primulina eburnea]|uniref:uncharacterized protein n=1 Tax=Primulina eburnea TaxID=1245227 RepID=UPI003C6C06D6
MIFQRSRNPYTNPTLPKADPDHFDPSFELARPSTNWTFFLLFYKSKQEKEGKWQLGSSSIIPKNPATNLLQTSFGQGLFGGSSSPIGPTGGSTSSGDKGVPGSGEMGPQGAEKGQVVVYDGASVWNSAILRGDLNKITAGFCSNVQERCCCSRRLVFPYS